MNRTGNYCAFYVDEPFNPSNLGANATKDFVYYNTIRAWKAKSLWFPFVDSHDKTYNVRDNSDWEKTLKPRLHERLSCSKNIILILSSVTKESRALKEELEYGIFKLGLPVVVVYPELDYVINYETRIFTNAAVELWNKVPTLVKGYNEVPTMHIPFKKDLLSRALDDVDFTVQHKINPGKYYL